MHVLLINQYYHPDIAPTAQLCTDWAEDLVRLGHRVTVLAGTSRYRLPHRGAAVDPSAAAPLPRRETHRGVEILRVPVWSGGYTSRSPLARLLARGGGYASFLGGALLALRGIERPDVVVALSTPPMVAALGLGAQAWLGARFVYWVQDVYPELLIALGVLRPASPAARGLAALSAALYRRADRVIALDEAMADRLIAAGAPRARVRVIDHFCDTRELVPQPPADNPLRARLGLGRDAFVVCYAGNHGHGHDFDTVIAALARQAAAGDRALHWLFVGDGEQRQRLMRSVPAALRSHVHFLPPQARSELPVVLTAGSVGLVTLKPELAGLLAPSKLYGLLSVGCPVVYVGPPRGRIPELLAAEPVGVALGNGDDAGLLRALHRLRADEPLRAEMAARARALAVTRYDRAHITAAHAALLAEVEARR
jgi:glycosyltransferase involved in cell wall biosynthesis